MALCAACKSIDFRPLLTACLQQCRDRQEANGEDDDAPLPSDNPSRVKHSGDIFEIEKSSGDCDVCKVIFQAFEKRKLADLEEARGLPIVFRAIRNKIEVCYDTEEGLIKLCGLDVYMNEADVNEIFRLCKIKEDSSPPILKMIEKDPCSKASLAVVSGWLRDCLKNHNSCKPPNKFQRPPKRLINVGNETQNPFLVENFPGSQQVEWLCLSYCWGGQPSIKLTTDTFSMLSNGVSLHEFDPTVRDAILVTRALELTYIWIDALCIIQDHNANDWNEQAPKMNEIYGGSTVTVVAASSDSVMNGFLKKRELKYIPIRKDRNPAGDPTGTKPPASVFFSPEWDKNEDELNGAWSKRGWTMQEGLLPSRLLYYTSSQMIWKCSEEQRFERGVTKSLQDEVTKILTYTDDTNFGSGWLWKLDTFMKFKRFPDYLPRSPDYPLLSDPETFRLWYDLIEEYTQRRFEHDSDRLIAISGLAKIFCNMIRGHEHVAALWKRRFEHYSDRLIAISGLAKIFGNMIRSHEYVAGLWKPDLIRGLMWYTNGAKLIPQKSKDNVPAPNNTFPSWSWASAVYEIVKISQKNNNNFKALSQVEDLQVTLFNRDDPFSNVKSGSVTITGPLKKVSRLYNKEWKSMEESMSKFERHLSEIVENESLGDVKYKYSSPPERYFAVLQMLEDIQSLDLLVLEATGEVSEGIDVYHRIGVLTLHYFHVGSAASPDVVVMFNKLETSRSARLGPLEEKQTALKGSNDVIEELRREPWKEETVIIV